MKLLLRSVELDWNFFSISGLTFRQKISFILKKYLFLIKNFIIGYSPGESHINLFGEKYFYEDKFGSAFLQSVYVDNAFLRKFINPGSTIIDVGANIGQFNFFCHNFLKAKKIYSFEPVKKSYEILCKNSSGQNYNVALTTKLNLSIHIPKVSLMASLYRTETSVGEQEVICKRLDEIKEVQSEKTIDLLKIDTEGSELDVLESARETIGKSKYLLLELSIQRPSAGSFMETVTWLKNSFPELEVLEVSRPYIENSVMTAIDVFIRNRALV